MLNPLSGNTYPPLFTHAHALGQMYEHTHGNARTKTNNHAHTLLGNLAPSLRREMKKTASKVNIVKIKYIRDASADFIRHLTVYALTLNLHWYFLNDSERNHIVNSLPYCRYVYC